MCCRAKKGIMEGPASASSPLRSGDPWVDRLGSVIRDSVLPVHIVAEPDAGVRRLLEAVATIDRPLLWLDYTVDNTDDLSALGNTFVNAVNRATGSNVLAVGTPLPTAVTTFSRLVSLLGPFVIAVSGAQRVPGHLQDVLAFQDGRNRIVVLGEVAPVVGQNWEVIPVDRLRVLPIEAAWYSEGRLSSSDVADICERFGGNYVSVIDAVRLRVGLPPLWFRSSEGGITASATEFGLNPRTLAEVLVRRKRFLEAFELICGSAVELLPQYIDVCGEAFFENGLFDRFWFHISRVDSHHLNDERVLRWLFVSAMAVNRHQDVVHLVEEFLRSNEAPELRAQYAAARPSRDFLAETTRSVRSYESPITLRHHAFALSLEGFHEQALEALHRALRLADVLGNDQMVVAIGTDMCIALQRVGSFREALWWGEWAVKEYVRRDLKENYRRVSGLAALASSKMLVGDQVGLREIVEAIQVSVGSVGVPSYEGVISTVADYHSISGSDGLAAELYGLAFEGASYDIAGLIAVDFVRCLVDIGHVDQAVDVGERVYALSQAASRYQRDCGTLALGIALKGAGDPRASKFLEGAVEGFLGGADAVRLCQACIHLADLLLRSGDRNAARDAASKVGDRLLELGDTGWRLLGGMGDSIRHVRELATSAPRGLSLCVLGPPSATLFAEPVSLTLRQLEILAVLADNPAGVSLEALAGRIYGDRGIEGTTKAAVSRLRNQVPLTSRPYQIAVPVRADFIELMDHLRCGRVRQALSLYRGQVLPGSEAPAIIEIRERVDESLRQAVLRSGDAEAMLDLASRTDADDLELLEEAFNHVPKNDPQSHLLRARIRQVRRDWGSDDGF
jgi:tetratricopeptide (TPR) repeat protein